MNCSNVCVSKMLMNSKEVHSIIGMILAFGNHMNGGDSNAINTNNFNTLILCYRIMVRLYLPKMLAIFG